jgi:Resolvase, N terminal domain
MIWRWEWLVIQVLPAPPTAGRHHVPFPAWFLHWKLDRLGRSLRHLVDTITGLADRGVGLRSLQEAIDTTTPGGKLVFHVSGRTVTCQRLWQVSSVFPPAQAGRQRAP